MVFNQSNALALLVSVFCTVIYSCRTFSDKKSTVKESSPIVNDLVFGTNAEGMFTSSGGHKWTKFVMTESDKLPYFMNANADTLHYPFATSHIPAFKGLTAKEFEKQTLFTIRTGISGNVYKSTERVSLSFVSLETLPHQRAIEYLKSLAKHITVSDGRALKYAYVPDDASWKSVEENISVYENAGFEILKFSDFSSQESVVGYSFGWNIGRLVRLKSVDVPKAYSEGRLRSTDILFTDEIGGDFPILAGVVAEAPINPGAHSVMLARALKTPVAHVTHRLTRSKLFSLVGKNVYLSVDPWISSQANLGVFSIESVEPRVRLELENLRQGSPLVIQKKSSFKALSGRIYQSCRDMNSGDQRYFGGKATNFRVLCDSIPSNTPKEAIGLSFDVWDRFLLANHPSGQQLKSIIDSKLSQLIFPPSNMATWIDSLKEIQKAILETTFPSELKNEVVSALKASSLSSTRTLRFRSSTNIEDSNNFNGAGLYDSFSGCLGDDTSEAIESRCSLQNMTKKPKPITETIKRVFASFYNEKAVFARKLLRVNENDVGMAILVHYSFPDEVELANGVLTTKPFQSDKGVEIQIFSHPNSNDVTDPSVTSPTEHVRTTYLDSLEETPNIWISRFSGLNPFGQLTLKTKENYQKLADLSWKVQKEFQNFFKLKTKPQLDMEFKLVKENEHVNLNIKQVRVMQGNDELAKKQYLAGGTVRLCLAQIGGFGDNWNRLVSNHFLKFKGNVRINSGWIDDIAKSNTFINGGELELLRDSGSSKLKLDDLVSAQSSYNQNSGSYDFNFSANKNFELARQSYQVSFNAKAFGSLRRQIILGSYPSADSVANGQLMLNLKSSSSDNDLLGTIHQLEAYYYACDELSLKSDVSKVEIVEGAVKAKISYQFLDASFLKSEQGLGKWGSVRFEGLSSSAFQVLSDAARTYAASHHNMSEFFLFEPSLDLSIDTKTLKELRAKNIRFIVVERNLSGQGNIRTIGFDSKVRRIPSGSSSSPQLNIDLPEAG